jgi:cyclopropane-fatty-acyl-phospholipid synthase
MWEFYLAGAEMGFRWGDHMNFQLQLTKNAQALPITRAYMGEGEADLKRREGQAVWRARRPAQKA